MSIDKKLIEVHETFKSLGKKNAENLKHAKIEPIHEKFSYSKNGIWAMIATMGSGKSYNYLKLATQQSVIFDKPYYELIVICSTSAELDETVKTFKPAIKRSEIIAIEDNKLLEWLEEYKAKTFLYHELMKFVNSDFKNPSEQMLDIIQKNSLQNQKRLVEFIAKNLKEIGWKTYPHRCLLILDDFAAHPLLKRKETPLCGILKKLRHYKMTVIICVQTVTSIIKDIRRDVSDFIMYPGISFEDLKNLVRGSSLSCFDPLWLWQEYSKIKDQHTMFTCHVKARRVTYTPPDSPVPILIKQF
jgi:hypothetical protein